MWRWDKLLTRTYFANSDNTEAVPGKQAEKLKFLNSGGSGFVGRHLTTALKNKGYKVTVVSRTPGTDKISWEELTTTGIPPRTKAVVSLAGQNVLDPTKRWTPGFKQNVWASRVDTTTTLAQVSMKSDIKPDVFLSISGVGVYNPSPTEEYNEGSAVKEFDFLSGLCLAWECAAKKPREASIRTVIIRSGVVLGKDGGMIKQLWLPFSLGLGGPIGSGAQYLPWIHIDDLVNLILFAIEKPDLTGILNGVAPNVITNRDFSNALAKAMSRPALFPIPTVLLNLAFNQERAKMMTQGQKVIPKRTLEVGFKFLYPNIDDAVRQIVKGNKT
ncbi:hypothetical protein RUM43_013371 [Polyplax serrata]|uniref:Epimerase family protein SDR39U1 n=1 Tax=Polyplax serrata TaxID=468196 RepID=A0AAN8P5C0_POLSC